MREWHTVTVAFSASSSWASGLPTTFERPTTATWRPASGIPWCAASSTTASAVAGGKVGSPAASRPSDSGLTPSTSLPAAMAELTSSSATPAGSGVCSMTASTAGSPLSFVSSARIASAVASAPRSTVSQAIPRRSAARCSDFTYQPLAGSSLATTSTSRGALPRSVSAAARCSVSALSAAASSLPVSEVVSTNAHLNGRPTAPYSGSRARPVTAPSRSASLPASGDGSTPEISAADADR